MLNYIYKTTKDKDFPFYNGGLYFRGKKEASTQAPEILIMICKENIICS